MCHEYTRQQVARRFFCLFWLIASLACSSGSAGKSTADGDNSLDTLSDTPHADADAGSDLLADSRLDVSLEECTGDPFEPNDSRNMADKLPIGATLSLLICSGDRDYFAISLRRGDWLKVQLLFERAAGQLDLKLYASDGELLKQGELVSGGLTLEFLPLAAGLYYIEISGYLGATNVYDLKTSLVQGTCQDDAFEQNDDSDTPRPITIGEQHELKLCKGDNDWFSIQPTVGNTVSIRVDYQPGAGELALFVYRRQGSELILIDKADAPGQPFQQLVVPPAEGSTLLIEVRGLGENLNAYSLIAKQGAVGTLTSGKLSGNVRFTDKVLTLAGFEPPTLRPMRRVELELVRQFDGQVLASGLTDDNGEYLLPYINDGPSGVFIRVFARSTVAGVRLQVQQSTNGMIYSVDSESIDESQSPESIVDVDIPEQPIGGAFNILDAAISSLSLLEPIVGPGRRSELTFIWKAGEASFCVTCYNGGQIFVSGLPEDPDHYDDPVLIHEIAHFFEDSWSRRDTPGGFHDINRSDPALAWSEGFAHFFQAVVRNSPDYLDWQKGKVLWQSIDSVPDPQTFGTSDGSVEGMLSEALVYAVLWKLYSGAPPETAPIPLGKLLLPNLLHFTADGFVDRGAPGVDLLDYLDGWFCLGLGQNMLIQTVVVDERKFPYVFDGPVDCLP